MATSDPLVDLRMMRDGICPGCRSRKHVEKSQSGEARKADRQVTYSCDACEGEWSTDTITEHLQSMGYTEEYAKAFLARREHHGVG